ncbi:AraC family transcriptional regulator [Nostoc sp. LPT]|uniref:helix-turn-helix domain-containing protein n=1 Tax=Nostoc sp. LPT TaxID=2815387 RepID=UPI001D8EF604|nr:AraC family transcriptional regulator [Nostoc sp. LPT]MBN4006332.1 helix-turn-helix transcriptional regulator [Nostoc sp. LPT]
MTITPTISEWDEWWAEAAKNSQQNPSEPFESYSQVPRQLGKGYERSIEVYRQLHLSIGECEHHDDISMKVPESNHPLQFGVELLGNNADDTLISGAGVQRSWMSMTPKSRSVGVNIEMPPELLATFFPTGGEIPSQFSILAKGNDWQIILQPKKTSAVNSVVQQIIYCPYQGITKLMFLQVRVLELIRLQLTPMLVDQGGVQSSLRLKPETITRIYHAKDILLCRLDNPPSLLELAQIVGVSERTLRYGFRELFNTTVFGYLTEQRMKQAEQLLREGKLSITEVANLIGYSQPASFTTVFKRKFGITPKECLLGKKNIFGV